MSTASPEKLRVSAMLLEMVIVKNACRPAPDETTRDKWSTAGLRVRGSSSHYGVEGGFLRDYFATGAANGRDANPFGGSVPHSSTIRRTRRCRSFPRPNSILISVSGPGCANVDACWLLAGKSGR